MSKGNFFNVVFFTIILFAHFYSETGDLSRFKGLQRSESRESRVETVEIDNIEFTSEIALRQY